MPVYNCPPPIDMFEPLSARLIYDGAGEPWLPRQLLPKVPSLVPAKESLEAKMAAGTEASYDEAAEIINLAKQLRGTPLERVCEIAGRACYDSFGRGRNSADFHKHILEVGHLSVLEHAAFTVRVEANYETIQGWGLILLNKPAVHVEVGWRKDAPGEMNTHFMEVTVNLRHVLEWGNYSHVDMFGRDSSHKNKALGRILRHHAHKLAPQIVSAGESLARDEIHNELVEPTYDEQKWVTLLLTGSRGFSHELVRHGDWTAISQRSTRYVDESESYWVKHPLENAWQQERVDAGTASESMAGGACVDEAQERYRRMVTELEPWLIARGVDKVSARKQARGAARGYLGNALYTEVVFSASITQWKRMLRQRLSPFADAEIREVFRQALIELKRTRYANSFEGWSTKPSPDGIGEVLVEPTAATP